jgi:glycosyltransferase involved in cell wall biosynthesis
MPQYPKIRFRLLSEDLNEPTSRKRGSRVYNGLRERGYDADRWVPGEQADIIVLQWHPYNAQQAKGLCDWVVLDCNDACFLPGHRDRDTFMQQIRYVDYATTGSMRIKEHLDRMLHPRCVSYMPEMVDVPIVRREPDDNGRILWVGHTDNIAYLAEVDEALERLSKYAEFRLTVCTSRVDSQGCSNQDKVAAKPYTAYFATWSMEKMHTELRHADIGISPLTNNEWCRCKSPQKAAGYAYLGIPVVASDMPSHREFIRDGETGYLCSNADEWEQALVRLLMDADHRAEIGAAGQAEAQARYSEQAVLDEWERVIKRLTGESEPTSERGE